MEVVTCYGEGYEGQYNLENSFDQEIEIARG